MAADKAKEQTALQVARILLFLKASARRTADFPPWRRFH